MRFLGSRWFLAPLGAALLCVLLWFAGPLIAWRDFQPFDEDYKLYIAMGVVVLATILFLLISWLVSRKREDKLVEGVTTGGVAKDEVGQAIDAQQAEQQRKLAAALQDLRKTAGAKGGMPLYDMPWYVIIGPPGAGKTTALLNSGLRFPLAERHGAQEMKGVGGTRNCDWYFTEEAVILDTAGRYTSQDSDAKVDQAGWQNFLSMLKDTRPRQPLNGIFVVFGIPDLLAKTAQDRQVDARNVRARLIELYERFDIRLPIYMVYTKVDRIAGFTEFYDELDREGREQVLGMTFPLDDGAGSERAHAKFGDAFERLLQRQRERLLDRLQSERDLARRTMIFGFPVQLSSLRPIIDDMLKEIFDASRYAKPMLVRGVYFTSATQEGAPIDRLVGVIAQRFGLQQHPMPPQVGQGRGFFLQRLLQTVVFGEAGLVGFNPRLEARIKLMRRVGIAAVLLFTLATCGAWVWSFLQNRTLVDNVAAATARLDAQFQTDSRLPLGNGDVAPILPLLDQIRRLPAGYAQQQTGEPAAPGFGLYQGDRLGAHTMAIYRRALQGLLLPRLITRAQQQLVTQIGDPEPAFLGLKPYLMLVDHSNLQRDRNFIVEWLNAQYGDLPEAQRNSLGQHFAALIEEAWDPVEPQADLVEAARQKAAELSLAQRAMRLLTSQREVRELAPWRVVDAGPETAQALVRRSGRPLTEGVSGLYTMRGYYTTVLPSFPLLLSRARADAWVLGDVADSEAGSRNVGADFLNLYMQNYIREWQAIIDDVRVRSDTDSQRIAQTLLIVSGVSSPLARLYREIARETKLTAPPFPAQAQTQAGTQVAQAVALITGGRIGQIINQLAYTATNVQTATDAATRLANLRGNPAQVVDDRFRWLHDFVGADGAQGTQLSDFQREIDSVARALNQALANNSGADAVAAQGRQLQTASVRLRPEVSQSVRDIIEQLVPAMVAVATQQMRQIWSNDIARLCQQVTQQRFPFVRTSPQDAPLDDFRRLFGPDQELDRFFKNNMRQYIDMTRDQWRPSNPNVNIDPQAVDQMQRAQRIREAFFSMGAVPSLAITVTALVGGPPNLTLELHGQVMTLQNGQGSPLSFQWSGGGSGVKLTVEGNPVFQAEGPWGFLRMYDRSSPRRLSDDRYEIRGEGGARFQWQANSLRNAMSVRRDLELFRCQSP
jgi:type VI secretion system protein ImpL